MNLPKLPLGIEDRQLRQTGGTTDNKLKHNCYKRWGSGLVTSNFGFVLLWELNECVPRIEYVM